MTIDSHAHLGNFNGKFYTPKDLLLSMDQADIQYSLIISSRITDLEDKSGMSMDEVIQVGKKYPRLKPIGHVNFTSFNKEQVDFLIKRINNKDIYGIKFYPGYEDYFPSNEKLYPLYEFCQKQGVPIIFHTGLLEMGFKGLLRESHPLTLDEVANTFPNLKIILAHVGNPWLTDAGAVMQKNKNVYADFSGYFTEYTSIVEHQIEDFVQQMLRLKAFLDNFEKFLFGTDYPLYSQKEYKQAVERLPFTEKEKELVFYKNAQKLFNLDL